MDTTRQSATGRSTDQIEEEEEEQRDGRLVVKTEEGDPNQRHRASHNDGECLNE